MPALQPFCPAGLHPLLPDPAGRHRCTLVGFSVGELLAREPPLDVCLSLVESEAEARKLEYSHSLRCRGASSNHPLSENYLRTSWAICTKTGQGRASKGKGFQTRQFRIETLVSQIKASAWLRMAADGRSVPVEVRCLAADATSFFSPLKEGWGRVTFPAALLSSHFPHLSRWV